MRPQTFAIIGLSLALLLVSLEAAPVPTRPATRHESHTETIPDSKVTFRMIAIPGGTYWRGSPDDEKGHTADEGPRHPVTIRPFWMGRCEVTWDEYDQFIYQKP